MAKNWISHRKYRTNTGLASGVQSQRRKAPLRKIVAFVREGDNSLFGRGDYVTLECGHNVFSKGTHAARCLYCLKENKT